MRNHTFHLRRLLVFVCTLIVGCMTARAAAPPEFPPFDASRPLPEAERKERLGAVAAGLSPDQVRRLIGAPDHTCRQILFHRCVEQWIYDAPFRVRLDFDCPRGEEARLQSVQPLLPAGQ